MHGGSIPPVSAIFENPNSRQKCGRAEGATLGLNSRQTQSPPRFSTLRVAQKVRFDPLNQEPWAYATGYEDRRYASVSQRA